MHLGVSVTHLPGQHTGTHSWTDVHTFSTQGSGVFVMPSRYSSKGGRIQSTTINSKNNLELQAGCRAFEISSEPQAIQIAVAQQIKVIMYYQYKKNMINKIK